jgi:hypothetical protein
LSCMEELTQLCQTLYRDYPTNLGWEKFQPGGVSVLVRLRS